jgi:ribulose-5-phosphate 4-epimerase/fuculose-1-phosphate aldolase
MSNEGYIKFNCEYNFAELSNYGISDEIFIDLIHYRQKLFDLGFIGALEDGTGFGNISHRISENSFLISGTATGNLKIINQDHFSLVKNWDIENNAINCEGKVKASSESLTHAVIYQSLKEVNAVIHIHSKALWLKYLNKYLTTPEFAEYGTVAIAKEIMNLTTENPDNNIIILGGHEDGIMIFGKSLGDTYNILVDLTNFES